ncbi:hypothetical protein ACRALDRAFT_1081261 [Sodiomyces alcalophilus JCM 7366]|uniref:uncharacterized protein n=1 Tax=Sodiomyces alcalophilus JCM 7366 TaxID=591952 RepID=UPI0039B4C14F
MTSKDRQGTVGPSSQGNPAVSSEPNAPPQGGDSRPHLGRPTISRSGPNDEPDDDEDDEGNYNDDDNDDFSSVSTDDEPPLIHAYGHTYHGSGRILTPNDESERARLDIQHNLFKACLDGRLTRAHLDATRPLSILDVGAGTGLWAVEMAQRHPRARIRAVDLSAALLPTAVPPNVVFEIVDAAEPWAPLGGEKAAGAGLDFVHVRNLVGGGVRDFRALYAQALRRLRPGGQIEVAEVRPRWFHFEEDVGDEEDLDRPLFTSRQGTEQEGSGGTETTTVAAALEQLRLAGGEGEEDSCRAFRQLEIYTKYFSEQLGVDMDPIPKVRRWLRDVGFEKIVEMSDLVPIKPVGGDEKMRRKGALVSQMIEYGLWSLQSFPAPSTSLTAGMIGIENFTLALFVKGGLPECEARTLLERVRRGLRNASFQAYMKVTFITARKPLQ